MNTLLAIAYFDNNSSHQYTEGLTISNSIIWISKLMDNNSNCVLGEVRKDGEAIVIVKRVDNVTKLKFLDASYLNNLNLSILKNIEIETVSTTNQVIGSNIKVGGSISFGNITQS
jgi:polynucleotide 5'-kinase involved in rRNA processing